MALRHPGNNIQNKDHRLSKGRISSFIKTEVPDFESYKGCCQLGDLEVFPNRSGFFEHSRTVHTSKAVTGTYYDILFRKKRRKEPGSHE